MSLDFIEVKVNVDGGLTSMSEETLYWRLKQAKLDMAKHPRSKIIRRELDALNLERKRRDRLEFEREPAPDLNAKNFSEMLREI